MRYLTGFHAIEAYLEAIERDGDALSESGPVVLHARKSKRIEEILARAKSADVKATRVDEGELDAHIGRGRHRGIALAVPYITHRAVDFRSFVSSDIPANAVVIALDGVTDPHNLGAILRSADQFGADLVIVPTRRSAQVNDTVLRTSAGAAAQVPLVSVTNLTRALLDLKEAGFWVFGADVEGRSVTALDMNRRVALVLGSEGKGISRLVSESCDDLVRIPAFGTIDSLNVSVATGVLLFEIRRQQGLFAD